MVASDVVLDGAQQAAAARLAGLARQLGRRRSRGVYLCGRPGRGKTMLMDHFFAQVRSDRKRRYHFHGFFAELHGALARSGSIKGAVDAVLGDAKLICFDEFHVHDIGDAMLLARVLDTLFTRRLVLVVTSNYRPEELLPNPLVHPRFVPTIERIRAHLDVVTVDGARDYRSPGGGVHGFAAGCYLGGAMPDGPATALALTGCAVPARIIESGCIAVRFADLFGAATSAADYVVLARLHRRWVVGDVPLLRSVPLDWTTRFVNFVDILYDAGLELTLYASAPLPELARGVPSAPDLRRTISRLNELVRQATAG